MSTVNLILMATGAYLLWFGIENFGGKRGPMNPGRPLQNLFQGKGLVFS